MSPHPPKQNLRSDLSASTVDGAAYSLMVGLGETYLSAYALALSVGGIATGLLAAVPMLVGAAVQLISPWGVRTIKSYRRFVLTCAAWQSLALVLFPFAPLLGSWKVAWLYLIASVYWASGLATGPAWNTWIDEIVPARVRTQYFAWRSRVSQACVLIGFASGGIYLGYAKAGGFLQTAFTVMFVAAGICRMISAAALYHQSDPSVGRAGSGHLGLRAMMRNVQGHAGVRLLVYLFGVQVAVQLAGPYFAPFMLGRQWMQLSYTEYMLLISLSFVGKVIALPAWGRLAKRAGVRLLMWIGGIGIAPLSACWLALPWIEYDVLYLAVVQVLGGVTWAAYELAFFLMFFETIPKHERTSVLTLYNFGNSLAMVVGAMLGAAWLATVGESTNAYLQLFGMSSLARFAALILLARVPQMDIQAVAVTLRVLTLRPSNGGSLDRPVLSQIPNGAHIVPKQSVVSRD